MNDGKIAIEIKESKTGGFEVKITDSGGGIPVPLQQKVFEPFFSHGKENGTGLGLTVAQKIVQDHGGELRLAKTTSAGTVFVVCLPNTPHLSPSQAEATPAVH
jgi:nitrogen-specific signal transduction histidine kinase